jgi:predicted outer membrane protein
MTMYRFLTFVIAIAMISPALGQNAAEQIRGQGQAGQGQIRQGQTTQGEQFGSQPGQPGQQGQAGQQGQVGQSGRLGSANQAGNLDTFIASCLLIGNQEEVALAQMAIDQAQSDQVKQFAQMLVNDHQKAIQKLQPLAKPGISLNDNRQASAQETQETQEASAQHYTANRQDLSRDTARDGITDQIIQLNQQAAQECLQMTRSMLQEKQGIEFDKAFAGMQVGAHVSMLAKLKASEKHASGELASHIQQSQQMVKSHLEQAKQLCKQLDDQASRESSRQSPRND